MDLVSRIIMYGTSIICIVFLGLTLWGMFLKKRGQGPADEAKMRSEGARFATDKNGRRIEYICYGSTDSEAPVILNIHGSSMEAQFEKEIHQGACDVLKVRGISISLPGYANTDLKIGRVVVDWPKEDLEAVLVKENVDKFYITGHSQGNPHAMAAAFVYPERVLGLGLNAPLLPIFLSKELGMKGALGADSLPYTKTLEKWYMAWYFSLLYLTTCSLTPWLPFYGICSQIPKIKSDKILGSRIKRSFKRANDRNGLANCWESARDVCYEWGFDPREMKINNLCVWHASDDAFCPSESGAWLANFFKNKKDVIVDYKNDNISYNHFTFCQGEYIEANSSMLKVLLAQTEQAKHQL